MSKQRARDLSMYGAAAAATFGAVAVLSATRKSAHVDRALAPRLALRPRSRGRRVSETLSVVAKWYTIIPAAIVAGAAVARARRSMNAGAPIAAAAITATL